METLCSVDGCGREVWVKSRGLCQRHYARWRRHGDPTAWKKPVRQVCSVDGCEIKQVALGLCRLHYSRQKRYGSTEAPERPTVCTVEGCEKSVVSWAMCDKHYRRACNGISNERKCRFCGGPIPQDANAQRLFCSNQCLQKELYFERRRTHRARWLAQYGLTVEQFDEMFKTQDSRCAICRGTDHKGRNWSVDHDHATGAVRGILCVDCNQGLGKFKDDPEILQAAIRYLSR